MKITSVNNDLVKYWCKLQLKKYRDEEQKFIIEGDHLVDIALKNNLVETLIVLDENSYDFSNKYIVTEDIMKKISRQMSISKVAAIVKYNYVNDIIGNTLLIDSLQDPGNLGTIIRSAVAFNFKTIVLGNNTVDIYNEKTIRASEGMIFNINVIKKDLFTIINDLKRMNYEIIGTDVHDGKSINKNNNYKAIIIGNEGNGMNPDLKNYCDYLVKLDMENNCESLNAGVAASLLMYEVYHG